MHGICFPGKSDKLCPQMAAKTILCNLFQLTAKASNWTSSRNCKYSDKDTIPRWLGHPLRKHCQLCPTGEPSQTGSASAWRCSWMRAFGFRQVPSRCFNLILRLLYFLCQCDEGVGAAQSHWFNPVMENHLREWRRQILQAAAWRGGGEKEKQPPAQCEFTLCGRSAGKTIILNVWIREPDSRGNVNNSFLCRANAARRLTVGLNLQWVAYLLSSDSFTPGLPRFPLQHKQHTKGRGVRVKTVSPSHVSEWSCHVVGDATFPNNWENKSRTLPTLNVLWSNCDIGQNTVSRKEMHQSYKISFSFLNNKIKQTEKAEKEQKRRARYY